MIGKIGIGEITYHAPGRTTITSQRRINLGLKITRAGEHILQIQLVGFNLDERAGGLLRAKLPVVQINDISARIPAIGVGAISLGKNPPETLEIKLDGELVDKVRLTEIEKVEQISAVTESLETGNRTVTIYPLEIWGQQIPAEVFGHENSIDLNGKIILPDVPIFYLGKDVITHLDRPLGIATELLTIYDCEKTIAYYYYRSTQLGEFPYLSLDDLPDLCGAIPIKSRDVYPLLVKGLIDGIISGTAENDFADRLMPPDVASGTNRLSLTGSMLEKTDLGVLSGILRKQNIELRLYPGVSSWLQGGFLYAEGSFSGRESEKPLLVIAVEKEGLRVGMGHSHSDISQNASYLKLPFEFKLNSKLPTDATEEERDVTGREKMTQRVARN